MSSLYVLLAIGVFHLFICREKTRKAEAIQSGLNVYIELVKKQIHRTDRKETIRELSALSRLVPQELTISLFDEDLNLIFDNKIPADDWDESSKQSPEIKQARKHHISLSLQEDNEYLHYAVADKPYVILLSCPTDEKMKAFLHPDLRYLIAPGIIFIIFYFLIFYISQKYVSSLKSLKEFIRTFHHDRASPFRIPYVYDELGEIQSLIILLYNEMEANKKNIEMEREKLLKHFYHAEEGISFFTSKRKNIYTNTYFIQYLNILLNKQKTFNANSLFDSPVFSEVVDFLNNPDTGRNSLNVKINTQGHHFGVKVIIFEDNSFEIILKDISESEKSNSTRAEITNNIAHELRTPVTSVRGYLETLINNKNLPPGKADDFIKKAYDQINRLTEIIQDVVLLSKTNDNPQHFQLEEVNIFRLVNELIHRDSDEIIQKANSKITIDIAENVSVQGNRTLLYSIFRNLGNNALKYAGENAIITVSNYLEDDEYYYFSFSDNGTGIPEEHITRIFERFYRIAEGRTRNKGGSGLGLSIVKDAVEFHHGEILARNKPEGGLEFLFTLRKY
jgi:two-component system phosphate regulon sensor histidine kinase PhoR